MSSFGDPEAHRRILHEISELPDGAKALAYLRAAVMGSMGSAKMISALHETPGLMEKPTKIMRVQLVLFSLTVRAAQGSSRYTQECKSATEAIEEVGEEWTEQRRQQQLQKQNHDALVSIIPCSSFTLLPTSQRPNSPLFGKDVGNHGGSGVCSSEVNEEFLYAAMSYVNYLRGFTTLWSELFGANYYIVDHHSGAVETAPQVPPHLYAVDWQCVLSPERQAWCKSLHDKSKGLLHAIVSRAMPLEAYSLYVLFAALSLRVRLLETAAEVFTWSSYFVDIPYCVRQLYISYRSQCEYACLQDVWHSFSLFDDTFIDDCGKFNLECSAAQGAFFETGQGSFNAAAPATATPGDRVNGAPRGRSSSGISSHRTLATGESGFAGLAGGSLASSRLAQQAHRGGVDESFRPETSSAPSGSSFTDRERDSDAEGDGEEDDDNEDAVSGRSEGTQKKKVCVPMFHTECRFTWLLQRLFWSLYGRCTLLFGSCIRLDLVPGMATHFLQRTNTATSALAGRPKIHGGGGPLEEPAGTPSTTNHVRGEQRSSTTAMQHASTGTQFAHREGGVCQAAAGSSSVTPADITLRSRSPWQTVKKSLARVQRLTGRQHPFSPRQGECNSVAPATTPVVGKSSTASSLAAPLTESPRTGSFAGSGSVRLPREPQAPFFLRYACHTQSERQRGEASDAGAGEDTEVGADDNFTFPDEACTAYLTEFTFLTLGGCYVLAHAIHHALTTANYPATLLMLSDNSTRPGLRNWVEHKYVICAVADDLAAREGTEPWVLNFVLPRFRLSQDVAERDRQERSLLDAIVPRLLESGGMRVTFAEQNSLFYVLNSGPYMDQGRNFFVLHMHVASSAAPPSALLQAESANAFGGLEDVRLAWYMTCSANEALRLADDIDSSNDL